MPVTTVSGDRRNGTIYLFNHHIYVVARRIRGVIHVKCRLAGCSGTGVFCEGDDSIRVCANHNHEPDLDEEDRLLFRQVLRDECARTTLDFRVIYDEQAPLYPYGSSMLPFEDARGIMRRERDQLVPPIPRNLTDLGRMMLTDEWRAWSFTLHSRGDRFYQRTVFSPDGVGTLFVTAYMADLSSNEPMTLYVGMLKLTPRQPSSITNVMVVGLFSDRTGDLQLHPVAVALLEGSSTLTITSILRAFIIECGAPLLPVSKVVCDLDVNVRDAVRNVWPTADTMFCHFSYSERLVHNFCSDGLYMANDYVMKILRKAVALSLLPGEFSTSGLDLLKVEVQSGGLAALQPFMSGLSDLYASYGSDLTCSLDRKYEVAIQKMVNELVTKLTHTHPRPTVWQFIDGLRRFEYDTRMRIANSVSRRRSRPNLRADVPGAFILNLVQNVVQRTLTLQEYFDRAEVVLKTRVREIHALLVLQLPLLRTIPIQNLGDVERDEPSNRRNGALPGPSRRSYRQSFIDDEDEDDVDPPARSHQVPSIRSRRVAMHEAPAASAGSSAASGDIQNVIAPLRAAPTGAFGPQAASRARAAVAPRHGGEGLEIDAVREPQEVAVDIPFEAQNAAVGAGAGLAPRPEGDNGFGMNVVHEPELVMGDVPNEASSAAARVGAAPASRPDGDESFGRNAEHEPQQVVGDVPDERLNAAVEVEAAALAPHPEGDEGFGRNAVREPQQGVGDVPNSLNAGVEAALAPRPEGDGGFGMNAVHEIQQVAGGVPHQAPNAGVIVCMVCKDAAATLLLIPCHHFGFCQTCRLRRQALAATDTRPDPEEGYVVNHRGCPVCRATIWDYRSIFVA